MLTEGRVLRPDGLHRYHVLAKAERVMRLDVDLQGMLLLSEFSVPFLIPRYRGFGGVL